MCCALFCGACAYRSSAIHTPVHRTVHTVNFVSQAPESADDGQQQKEETVQVKGGGLFGFFQQDTVFADDTMEAVPPSTELVERAVTKKGTGRQSVKELIARKVWLYTSCAKIVGDGELPV